MPGKLMTKVTAISESRPIKVAAAIASIIFVGGVCVKAIKGLAEWYSTIKELVEMIEKGAPWLAQIFNVIGSDAVSWSGCLLMLSASLYFWRDARKIRQQALTAIPTESDDPVQEVKAIETILEVQCIIEQVNWKTYREERIYEYAATLGAVPPPKPMKIDGVDPNLVQRCHALSLETKVKAFGKMATELRRLGEELDKWNASPSLDVRGIRVYTQQVFPPILQATHLEMKNTFGSKQL
ncbi:MAG: hypothetical protein QOE70_4032 [Chthoniobacter sp.]|jgi:hypothetical protein|nr:hypothetical protein [Chthoniobacter sp.]